MTFLKKDGIFFCSTPVVGINEEFDIGWAKIADKRHLHSFTEEEIKTVCYRNGLTFNRFDTNGGVMYFESNKVK